MGTGGTGVLDVTRRMFDLYEASVCDPKPASQRAFLECWDSGATVGKMRPPGSEADIDGLRLRYGGLAGVMSAHDDMIATWSEMHVPLDHLELVGDGRALALGRLTGTGRMGQPLDTEAGFVLGFRAGLINALDVHLDLGEAIDAARGVRRASRIEWAQLGSASQLPAKVVASPAADRVLLEVAESWYIEAPVAHPAQRHVEPGTPALVFFRDNGRLAAWYIPDVQVGMDLRGIAADRGRIRR